MVVIVAGMYRSGSTFLFNVVQEILEADGPVVTDAANGLKRFTSDIGNAKHAIIKAHRPNAMVQNGIRTGAFRCIASFRNPEEAIASWRVAFNFPIEEAIHTIQVWIDWYVGFRFLITSISYRAIDRHPYLTILRIQFWLKGWIFPIRALRTFLRLRKSKLMKDLAQLEKDGSTTDIGFSYYETKSMFHRRHITSLDSRGAWETLTSEEKEQVEKARQPNWDLVH